MNYERVMVLKITNKALIYVLQLVFWRCSQNTIKTPMFELAFLNLYKLFWAQNFFNSWNKPIATVHKRKTYPLNKMSLSCIQNTKHKKTRVFGHKPLYLVIIISTNIHFFASKLFSSVRHNSKLNFMSQKYKQICAWGREIRNIPTLN